MFDTKKFPGKRTFYKWSAPGVIEIALLADGVPADKLYPLDLDRAFKKLDTIKSDIVWWGGVVFGFLSALINLPIVEKPVPRPAVAAA